MPKDGDCDLCGTLFRVQLKAKRMSDLFREPFEQLDAQNIFTAGNNGLVPEGDAARQAIDSLRGYAYQVTAAALAWLDLGTAERLFLRWPKTMQSSPSVT